MWCWVCGCCMKPIVFHFLFPLLSSSQIPYPVSSIRGTQNSSYASTCIADVPIAYTLHPSRVLKTVTTLQLTSSPS